MPTLNFSKMNGAGNDFIMIDNRDGALHLSPETIARLCDRHRGIGADGLIMVERDGAALRMRYHNSDGGEAEMCGNGARCFAKFAAGLLGTSGRLDFQTLAGPISSEILDDGRIRLEMSEPHDFRHAEPIDVDGARLSVWFLNTGVPHAVVPVEDVEAVDVGRLGRLLRHHPRFAPRGTNVNFLQAQSPGHGLVRTYERGVEAETLACGTGVVASALVLAEIQACPSPISLLVRGGEFLEVGFSGSAGTWQDVTLCGPADLTFVGSVTL